MENKDKPAFSVALYDNGNPYHSGAMGLTKREYFAGLAMQGLLASNATYGGKEDIGRLCSDAIRHSDELLKQLEHGK